MLLLVAPVVGNNLPCPGETDGTVLTPACVEETGNKAAAKQSDPDSGGIIPGIPPTKNAAKAVRWSTRHR